MSPARGLRRPFAIAVAAVLATVAGLGCPSVGTQVALRRTHPTSAPTPPAELRQLKLVTFNLYNRPWDRTRRLARAREVLLELDADVVALQEVSEGLLAGEDAKQMLAELPYPFHAYFMLERWGPLFESGLYLLSRWPLADARGVVHEVNRTFDRKGFLTAAVDAPGQRLRVVTLHQASTRREAITGPQYETVAAMLGASREAHPDELLVVLGDFNAFLDEQPVARIMAAGRLVAAGPDPRAPATWAPYGGPCSAEGGERIDHVLVSGRDWRVVGQGVVQPKPPFPSDHCPVWAVIGRQADPR